MKNMINWFEIPVLNFSRAKIFYKGILDIEIEEIQMQSDMFGFFPYDGTNVSGAIVQGVEYKPSTEGSTIYLNGGDDLQIILDRIAESNCSIIVPKTQVSEEIGYIAIFIDTEGNKIALHSPN